MRLSLHSLCEGFVLGIGMSLLLVTVPPATAQGTPTPPAPNGSEASLVREINSLGTTIGANNLLLLAILLLVGVVVWVVVRPALSNATTSNQAVIQTSARFITLSEDSYKVIDRNTDGARDLQKALVEVTGTMVVMKTSMEANSKALMAHVSSERETGVKAVTEFVGEQHGETRRLIEQAVNAAVGKIEERVDAALQKWDEIMPRIETRLKVQDDTIRVSLLEIHNELVGSKQEAQKAKIETGKLPPLPAPEPEPDSPPNEANETRSEE